MRCRGHQGALMIPERVMQLWTWQLPDWDITCQPRDCARMADAWGHETAADLAVPYVRLYDELGTSNIIWCFALYRHWLGLDVRRLWVLDVPSAAVLRFTDSPCWAALIRHKMPEEQAWRSLFLDEEEAFSRIAAGRADTVVPILRVPVTRAWVTDKSRFNTWSRRRGPLLEVPYHELPTSEKEARDCRSL